MQSKVIVISGYSSISPLGLEMDNVIDAYNSSRTLLRPVEFNNRQYVAGAISEKQEQQLIDFITSNVKLKRLDRSVQMAVYAAEHAIKKSNLGLRTKNIGVSIGSSRGATGLFEKYYSEYIQSSDKQTALLTSPLTTLGNISSAIAQHLGSHGFVMSHSMTCSSALQAVTNAVAWLRADMADCFLVGGAEAPLTAFTFAQLEALGIYSSDNDSAYPCRPLSNELDLKNTMTLGEGAAMFVLEKKNIADLQKGDIVVEAYGFGFEEIPSATGLTDTGNTLYDSMQMALSQLEGKQVDAIITHSPGTVKGDAAEYAAIVRLFGENKPVLYNNKWKIGHTYGASGAFNLETAILLLQGHIAPYLPYSVRYVNPEIKSFQHVMVNSAGFGGNSSSIIVGIVK